MLVDVSELLLAENKHHPTLLVVDEPWKYHLGSFFIFKLYILCYIPLLMYTSL